MFCERCGSEIADTTAVCPRCSTRQTRQPESNAWQQPVTNYGQYIEGEIPSIQHGYAAQPEPPRMYNDIKEVPQPHPFKPIHPVHYASPPANHALNVVRVSTKNNNALIVEIILSLFGLFGVGWLLARETTIGTLLLICSVFIYWPLIILGTIFTLGLGLICLGPLAIGAIMLNILLLNKILDQQATQYVITQQPVYMSTRPGH